MDYLSVIINQIKEHQVMNFPYQEPSRFADQDAALDNFSDLANRTKVKQKGLFSETLPYPVKVTVTVANMDDLVLFIEQDYHLKKVIWNKLEYINKEKDLFEATCRLVEVYLSIGHIETPESHKVRTFVLSNLNLI